MTSRERLLTALNHEEADRVPIYASYTPEAERRVLQYLGADSGRTETYEAAGGPLPVLMGHDFLVSWVGPCTGYYARPDREYTDEWGIGWKWFQNEFGAYTEMVNHPLARIKDPSEFELPDFTREDRYTGVKILLDQYGEEFGIVGACCCTLLELAWYLRGLNQVLTDLALNKDFAHAYFDKLLGWIQVAGSKMVRLGVDVLWIGDDVGTQNRMMINPEMWREFLKPRYAKLFAEWKAINPQVKIAFHSDGCIYPIIGDLVEIGLDILNPIQPKSMDPARIKRDFGQRLTLWGTLDIQQTLPFGTPQDVADEVKLRVLTAGQGGGLILSPAHNIQPEVPVANILSFYEAAKTYGRYPLRIN